MPTALPADIAPLLFYSGNSSNDPNEFEII